uniref:arsenate reductase (glutathione/glutaredoxin) n=1 Tax=Pteris vittata TaxID=13821 RepID=B8K253_PTEVI|nr:putative arsenate reductase [Pteris vittata]
MASPPTLSYITASELQRLQPNSKLAIIDVRDEERSYDGHIAGSWHFASDTFVEELPALVGKLEGQEAVVFHCAKSQIRGPTCAKKFVDHLATLASYKNAPQVYVLERGFNGWASAGHPVCNCAQPHCKGC